MTYSNLYCVLTDDDLIATTLNHAVALAEGHDAHLDVLCLGIDHSPAGYDLAGAGAAIHEHSLQHASEAAQHIEAQAREHLRTTNILWSVNSGVAGLPGLGWHVAAKARYSDLVILPKPYDKERGPDLEVITEAALFEANIPVLVVSGTAVTPQPAKRIVLGWNASTEALNAVRAALPLLQMAEIVHVTVIDPSSTSPTRSDPGGLLAQYLARHGVRVEVNVLAKTLPRISDVLNRHAMDIGADLIVMGAYGHSRMREAIFGGATRDMLQDAELPVLMSH